MVNVFEMTPETFDVVTPDGTARCTEHRPQGPGPFPAVLFLMDALGVRPALQAMAARFAVNGLVVLVPNLLYRAGDFEPFNPTTVWTDEAERRRLMGVMGTVQPEGTMRDVGLYLDVLARRPKVKPGPVGVVGYCLGGMLAFRAAAAHASRFSAAASIHGGHLVTDKPDSPHLSAAKVKAQLYFGCADNDRSCTPEHRATLEAALTAAGCKAEVEFYAGKAHGWAVSDTPAYDRAGSERHFERVGALFKATLSR
jgi:carboxymethylenebutenolidase